jgi:hypothetical protein
VPRTLSDEAIERDDVERKEERKYLKRHKNTI